MAGESTVLLPGSRRAKRPWAHVENREMRLSRTLGTFFLLCFLIFATITVVARMLPRSRGPVPAELGEDWYPDLSRVRSIDDAVRLLPRYIQREHGSRDARVAAAIDHFVRDRFFHAPSYLSARQDWLAVLASAFWVNLRIPVLPDDILDHRRAICSQQAIVFMELLKRFRIHYASVLISWPPDNLGSTGHFAVAARVDGRWIYFDPDEEAERSGVPVEQVISGSALSALYRQKPALLADMRRAAALGRIRLAHFDQNPAPRGGFFQTATEWFSAWGWLVFALLGAAFTVIARLDSTETPILLPAE